MDTDNNVSQLSKSTSEIAISDGEESFEGICESLFAELAEAWLEKNAFRLLSAAQDKLQKPALKRTKSNYPARAFQVFSHVYT
jgi:hypothetical protein